MMNYELNDSQREAVLCIDAPSLVIAGAGSGKTRVLTYKIAYLLEQGMQPWNILALTFTNKAAREMRERIAKLVSPEKAAALWMGTFHSIFARILRIEAPRLGYQPNYTIYDAADSLSLIKLIIREMNLDEKVYKPSAVQSRISNAKNRLVLPSGYNSVREFRESDAFFNRTLIPEIYRRYQERLKQANTMDFDDLLLNMWLLLKHNPEVAAQWQERFHFVLVDEYQDTNFAQHQIVWLLTNKRQRVCVVGDDAQSIYSFRGADIDNILHFQEAYVGARLFKLEQNYRSTQTIVNAAGSLIRNNREQISKNVFSEKEVGNPLIRYEAYSDTDEANIVLREVQRIHRAGVPYRGMAVLYRTNAQSRKIEDCFLHGHVPYHIYAGTSFYQREEIKDMLCYLRLTANPYDEESLRRIINKPARGIGDTTVKKLLAAAASAGVSVWDVLEAGNCPDLNAGTLKRLSDFHNMISDFHQRSATDDAHTLALHIAMKSGLREMIFSGHDPEDLSRQENLQELLDSIGTFVDENMEQGLGVHLSDYLQEASLATDLDRNNADKDADAVNMMTIHSAKGLEFPVVFVVGLEEGLFPGEMSLESPRALEEERRLFYVALTRAEKLVILTYAKSRFRNGKMEFSRPSRFIREIPQQYMTPRPPLGGGSSIRDSKFFSPTASPKVSWGSSSRPMPSTTPPKRTTGFSPRPIPSTTPQKAGMVNSQWSMVNELSVGASVVHERFGRGVVQAIEGTGLDAKATVQFENAGTKVLMLRFAKLTLE
ncbi:MAG: UvrD-helicase domain-containing protein [Bacteroidaceae bacterium]|nr:UvrD-helicase domain-containing protein [Bacteroidaceae bacterium]